MKNREPNADEAYFVSKASQRPSRRYHKTKWVRGEGKSIQATAQCGNNFNSGKIEFSAEPMPSNGPYGGEHPGWGRSTPCPRCHA